LIDAIEYQKKRFYVRLRLLDFFFTYNSMIMKK